MLKGTHGRKLALIMNPIGMLESFTADKDLQL